MRLSDWVTDRFETLCDTIGDAVMSYVPELTKAFNFAARPEPVPVYAVNPDLFRPGR